MKNPILPRKALALVCLATLAVGIAARAQTIPNPSFEADAFTIFPGYVSDNGAITGWSDNADARVGINQGGGPFADNGTIPAGSQAGFIQSDGGVAGGVTLSTIIDGLTVGQAYKVNFRVNARATQNPKLKVEIDGTRIIDTGITAVGGTEPYKYFAFDFTAASESQNLTLRNDQGGDNTLVVDDFSIAPSTSAWSYAAWTGDGDAGIDSSKHFTHAYSFGSGANATINGIVFIGVGGGSPQVAGSFATTGLPFVFNNDVNNLGGGSRQLANDFCYGDGGTPNWTESITIKGLTPGTEYVATIYTVGWENGTRAATFSVGEDRLTVNQDHFGDNNGLAVSYHYVADSTSITISYLTLEGNTFHTYGFVNFAANAPAPPNITQQPTDQCVQAGQDVTFTVSAVGTPVLTYKWRKNGTDIDGETSSTLTIGAVSAADMGAYSVVIDNGDGEAISRDALLEVGIAIANPSFEVDTFTAFPGYVSGNGPITGWTALNGHGINPGGGSPFADNGTIPQGSQVAFMQQDGALSQTISGFTPGLDYYVVYYENARSGGVPSMEVQIGGNTIVPAHPRAPVGGANPYVKVTSDVFTADTDTLQLSFIKSNPQGGDTTALIDNVCVVELVPGTGPRITVDPTALIVQVGDSASFSVNAVGSLPFTYQWRKGGVDIDGANERTYTIGSVVKTDEGLYSVLVGSPYGSDTSADAQLSVFEPIPDLYNTGVDNARTVLADGQNDPHYALTENADGGPISAIVQDSTAFPIVGGPWLANTASSKWVGPRLNTAGAAGGRYVYRTTIDLTDRDPSTAVIIGRWSVDNSGVDIMVNGVSTGNPSNPGFNVYTPFTIDSGNATFVAGINNIDFLTDNFGAGWTGLRVEIDQSNVKIPPGIAPSITLQPVSQKAVEGDTVIFRVAATGSNPLAYQWKKNGVDLPGKTSATLTLVGVVQADSGNYSVSVGNVVNSVNSDVVSLCVSFSRLPGVIFGTGVDEVGAPAANGSTDIHYILAASADGAFPGPDAIVADDTGFPIGGGPWVGSGPNSKWIGPQVNQGTGNAEGDYTYQTFFDLTGYDATQLRLVGKWAVDNTGIDILINGASTGITSPGFGSFTQFTITTGLIAGPNTLDFKMNNAPSGINPTGLRVDIEVQSAIQPTMTITPSVGGLTISWSPTSPCQKLQRADDVTGPWTTIDGATSPYPITTGAPPARFYKIVEP